MKSPEWYIDAAEECLAYAEECGPGSRRDYHIEAASVYAALSVSASTALMMAAATQRAGEA